MPALPGLEHVLIDARGRQHVVLRADGAAMQFLIEGADVTSGPVRIALRMPGLTATEEACAHVAALRRNRRRTSAHGGAPSWSATAVKLRSALIALDGRAAGARHREIAVVLYGADYVASRWRRGLKLRMRRHLQRGLRLSTGGYRRLLR